MLAEALAQAGTVVCEPMASVRLEFPAARIGAVLSLLAGLGAAVQAPSPRGDDLTVVDASLPSARVHSLQGQLPGLTGGQGVLESSFGGHQPVQGIYPIRYG